MGGGRYLSPSTGEGETLWLLRFRPAKASQHRQDGGEYGTKVRGGGTNGRAILAADARPVELPKAR